MRRFRQVFDPCAVILFGVLLFNLEAVLDAGGRFVAPPRREVHYAALDHPERLTPGQVATLRKLEDAAKARAAEGGEAGGEERAMAKVSARN